MLRHGTGGRPRTTALAASLVAGMLLPTITTGQQPADTTSDSVRNELARLRARLDSLSDALQQLKTDTTATVAADPVAGLRAAALAAVARTTAEQPSEEQPEATFTGRQRALQALNPEISVGGDFLVLAQEGQPGQDNFLLREAEFAFQAVLDPFSRAKVIVSHHAHGAALEPFPPAGAEAEEHAHVSGLEVEEAYAQWVNLPGGVSLTVGQFRQKLGTYNRWHRHALPWQGLPLVYGVLLGDHGLSQTGVSLHWLAPLGGPGTYEVWLEGARGGNEVLFGHSTEPNLLGHVNAFYELSPSTYFELGVSGVAGNVASEGMESTRRLFHVEAGFSWRPPGRELYREVTVRGAFMRTRGPDLLVGPGVLQTRSTSGGFAFIETRLGRRWLAGLRYDRVENPADPGRYAWMVVPTLTWWQSEFVRGRAEYDWLHTPTGARGQLLVQLTFAMGPHKHETY